MDLHLSIDAASARAPYEQIVAQVVDAVVAGQLAVGTRLPTVRALADELGLAVNTVAKAYKQLEVEGHVQTRGRHGTFVLGDRTGAGADDTLAAATALVRVAKARGLTLEEATGLLRRQW